MLMHEAIDLVMRTSWLPWYNLNLIRLYFIPKILIVIKYDSDSIHKVQITNVETYMFDNFEHIFVTLRIYYFNSIFYFIQF